MLCSLTRRAFAIALIVTLGAPVDHVRAEKHLQSWNDGPAKQAIVDFVKATTDTSSSSFDRRMLEYTKAGGGARLAMLLLHDDAAREYAYGPADNLPDTKVGTFTQELYGEAKNKGWVVISMKNDWRRVFAFELAQSDAPKPASPDEAGKILQDSKKQDSETSKEIAECLNQWGPQTQMTKEEWAASCRQTLRYFPENP